MAYIGRSGWNDLAFGGAIPDEELLDAVDESYRLVVAKLPKKLRPDGWDVSAVRPSPVRLAGDGEPDQPGDHQRDVQDAGDLLDHHQRPGVGEHREHVGQAHAGQVGERQEQQVEPRVGSSRPRCRRTSPARSPGTATKT